MNDTMVPKSRLIFAISVVLLTAMSPFASAQNSSLKPRSSRSIDELFLFQPTKHPAGNWNPKGLEFRDVQFKSGDGTKLHGWYCPAQSPKAVVLYLHGNAGNITHRAGVLRYLQQKLNLTVFIFDYRGYGRSEGVATAEGVVADAEAARKNLAELSGVRESDVVVMGRSLGGAVAVQLVSDNKCRALVIESSFSSLKSVAKAHFPRLAWLVPGGKLNSAADIAKYRGPLLQSHGDADRVVPFTSGARLFQAAGEPKTFVRISGGRHNDPQPVEYYQALNQFLGQLPKR